MNAAVDVAAGLNVTVLAYGQTSSGKSYTMFGSHEPQQEQGLIPRTLRHMIVCSSDKVCRLLYADPYSQFV